MHWLGFGFGFVFCNVTVIISQTTGYLMHTDNIRPSTLMYSSLILTPHQNKPKICVLRNRIYQTPIRTSSAFTYSLALEKTFIIHKSVELFCNAYEHY